MARRRLKLGFLEFLDDGVFFVLPWWHDDDKEQSD